AGDSRAVLCRDAAAYRLTEDHKPHLPHERARIEEAGGRVDFQRCWRVVVEPRDGRPGSGLAEPYRYVECEPDVTRLALQPRRDTFVVLGSDGLWDVLSDTDAVVTVASALKVCIDACACQMHA
ncbi:phosphatase 2C-like domain-containing protein, partial [Scenedesmus sp. NREL 46B-D3]